MAVKLREIPKGSGKWFAQIDYKGKRKSKYIGKDKNQAKKIVDTLQAKLVLGDLNLDIGPEKFYREYAEKWLNYIRGTKSPATYERYNQIQRDYVLPVLGEKCITRIKRSTLKTLLLSLLDRNLSRKTVCLVRDVINGPFLFALDDEVIEQNPVSGLMKSLNLQVNKSITVEPMNPQESTLFLNTCKEAFPEHYPFFLCAFRTGMRLGELLALEWEDVDFNSRFIRVARSYKRKRVSSTKTGKVRRVDMSQTLKKGLEQLFVRRKKDSLKSGAGEPCPIVFHQNGRHMEQNTAQRLFNRILKRSGIRRMRFHDIRHTFASQLLSNGESPAYVKEQMGHSSIQITVDIYGHLIPSSNRSAVDRLDRTDLDATYAQPR